jgi:hypothetical protein
MTALRQQNQPVRGGHDALRSAGDELEGKYPASGLLGIYLAAL